MHITVKKKVAEAIGFKKFVPYDMDEKQWSWSDSRSINLFSLKTEEFNKLKKLLEENKEVPGVKTMLNDIDVFVQANEHDAHTKVKAKTCLQFAMMLTKYLMNIPGHRIYERHGEDQWLPYYVNDITFHPRQKTRDGVIPAYVTMDGLYEEFGGRKKERWVFEQDDFGRSVVVALAKQKLQAETKQLRTDYLKQAMRFGMLVETVGHQVYARGTGTDDLDGNKEYRSGWWSSRTNTIQMERPAPTRCVVDVFYEDPKTERGNERYSHVSEWFWPNKRRDMSFTKENDTEEEDECLEDKEDSESIEVPIHPMVPVFDMSKHIRLRVHVDYLEDYKYDETIDEKLIIPPDHKKLIQMLVEHKESMFSDLVKGKNGGAVVLLSGKPGVGKTLTAEVYAECKKRALYSVQCSQLGTDPDNIEDELLKVFARARRWNAITLLDEADVYVRSRGESLEHNAIVGVFLRVLEYQSSVLFLTTNRADDIDDAIASRCIARIAYGLPDKNDQASIWKMLATHNGAELSDKEIATIVKTCGDHSGRDIKNLLKLAMMLKPGEPVTVETIQYVKRFKPTE